MNMLPPPFLDNPYKTKVDGLSVVRSMLSKRNQRKSILKLGLILTMIFGLASVGFSQTDETEKPSYTFRGNISATNNGISLVPTFSLGRPAVVFELSLGGERLSFDPEIRFAMDGKPWSFILWWRYKVIKSEKFNLNMGVHPAFVFREVLSTNGFKNDLMVAQRFFASEVSPSYNISKKVKIGLYYLHSLGLDQGLTKNTQFLAFNMNFSDIHLSDQIYLNIRPQVFYLKMDERDGYYANTSVLIAKRNFPLAIGSIVNRSLRSDIIGNKDWVWNVSLNYSFHKTFARNN
ncbi:hypothetical protein [Rhodonellum sp.]|uniref:hypothetical protein n=1 Tax=Rhodonellum sp. TaxID=2231180 RepID=UPI00272D361F|nr:hypothetical protein [Rhodonellum sp.]